MYCRGPFLQLLRDAPEQGLSFVIKLTNFATRRYVDDGDHGLTLTVHGQTRLLAGIPTSSAGTMTGRSLWGPSSRAPSWPWRNGSTTRSNRVKMSSHG